MSKKNTEVNELKFLMGGGEMGERIRTFNWVKTPLGPIEEWPQSLKTSVGLMLNSQHPMWIGWGPDVTFLYNDAYIQVLSLAKHPWALGKPTAQVWAEIWNICGPLADKVFHRGEASFLNDVRLFMNRGDFLEETFYSFSYSPIRDESGNVGGLFCPSAEVTARVLNTRRLRTLSELAAESLVEKSIQGACASAATILRKNPDDAPFVLIYLIDGEKRSAFLEQTVGMPKGMDRISPESVDLADATHEHRLWPLAEVVSTSKSQIVSLKGIEGFPLGATEQHITEAFILPLISRGQERTVGFLIAGINPNRRLDAEYRTFYELIAGHIATAIQNASAAEEEKRRADMLAELDRAKTTFFSNVSHELRTPLTLILGPLEDEMRESPKARERLELVHRNSLRLLKLVNTLLDFSRIEAGRVEASFEPTDLAAFTTELASVFRSGIEKAGLNLIVDCPPLAEPIYVDREMWEKIVFNLLSNALKFTAQGEIEIKLGEAKTAKTRRICLSVRDTGIGIAENELPRVFERFHRMKNTWARSHEGTGIGLALVQELALLHGGDVSVESVEGRGTIFSVWIPMGTGHLPRERISASRSPGPKSGGAQPFVEETLRWLPDDNGLTDAAYADAPSFTTNPALLDTLGKDESDRGRPDARIILADDNSDMRGYIHRLLAKQGYDVIAVGDGQAALEAARARPPSLVLSDVMMPRLTGFELLRELRNDPATKAIPIILLSARAGEEARVEGVEAGADDYLTKPFSARELIARVATHLELAQIRKEAQEAILDREERLRQALIEREKSEEKVRATLDSITDGLHVVDAKGRFTYFNASARRMLSAQGMDPDALMGRDYFEVFPETLTREVGLTMKRSLVERVPTEAENLYPPWQRWFSVRHYPMAEGGVSTFFQDITESKLARKALAESEQRLRTVNSQLADKAAHLESLVQQRTAKLRETIGELEAFSYSIAHDMRAPLRSLQGFSDILLNDYGDKLDSDGQRFLKRIAASAGRMDKLIQDVLNYSRVVRGELPLETVDLDALLHEIVDTYPAFTSDKADIVLQRPLPAVLGNEAMLTQIVSNLMGNAVKFVAPGVKPQVKIWAEERASHVRLYVKDNGIGIEPDQHEKIFSIFQQVNKDFEGTGIGLAIVKKAIERMGGKVGLQSELDQGSTFWIEIQAA
jgi:PAS domain S-box-containing protein